MANITQLPDYLGSGEGIHPIRLEQNDQLPPAWRPDLGKLKILSFPTPFGRAEATKFAMMDRQGWPTDSQGSKSVYCQQFESLLLGSVLGYFNAKTYDLKTDSGKLGQALVNVAPNDQGLRYLTILSDHSGPNPKPYGVTHPECLFYAHARVSAGELVALNNRVTRDLNLNSAKTLLADLKKMLDEQKRWDDAIPWMRGVERVIGLANPSPGLEMLQCDASSVAAIPLVTRNPVDFSKRDLCLLWIPRLNPGIRRKFQGMVRGDFNRENGCVSVLDARETRTALIRMPEAKDSEQKILRLGAGILDVPDPSQVPEYDNSRKPNISGADGKPGLRHMLQPVTKAITEEIMLGQPGPLTSDSVRRFPALYPDVVRWIVATMGNVLADNARVVQYSSRLNAMHNSGVLKSFPDVAAFNKGDAANHGYVCRSQDGKEFCLVERIEGKDVGDLRSLGMALFMHFTSKAQVEGGRLKDLEGGELIRESDDHPLEPNYRLLMPLQDGDNRRQMGLCLATIQRFWKTYKQYELSNEPAEKLVYLAAREYCLWALGGQEPMPNGSVASRWIALEQAGLMIPLAFDELDIHA